MPLHLRMILDWHFYQVVSGEAGHHDVPAYDWFGMYCGYSI